jgi:flagellar assembly protein FliH
MTEIDAPSACTKTNSFGDEFAEPDTDQEPFGANAAEETKRGFEAGREQGLCEARAAADDEKRALLREAEKKRTDQAVGLAAQLANERDNYLQTLEHEVVKLALAIAARILRREAQIDPLFLLGAVRVALGQLAESMQVKLRIPACEAELWTETLAHLPNLKTVPSVIADDRIQLGDCVIETEMGSVNLSLNSQLQESERILSHGSSANSRESRITSSTDENEERM